VATKKQILVTAACQANTVIHPIPYTYQHFLGFGFSVGRLLTLHPSHEGPDFRRSEKCGPLEKFGISHCSIGEIGHRRKCIRDIVLQQLGILTPSLQEIGLEPLYQRWRIAFPKPEMRGLHCVERAQIHCEQNAHQPLPDIYQSSEPLT
jgi:hypothetical protein